MKKLVYIMLLACAVSVSASNAERVQPPSPIAKPSASYIKGTCDIAFPTVTEVDSKGNPLPGVSNTYKLNLNVSGVVLFSGEITHLPTILSDLVGREIQSGQLDYGLDITAVSRRDPNLKKPVGRLVGTVPIDKKGVYLYDKGTLRIGWNAIGKESAGERKFTGSAIGKPPKDKSLLAKAKKEAISITREVKGKKVAMIVADYDKMRFPTHGLAGGPTAAYPDAQVTGDVVYDYALKTWFFYNAAISYTFDGKAYTDKLSGNIRWLPSQPKTGGDYYFDVRVNEPVAKTSDNAAFEPVTDTEAFFEANPNVSSLGGVMKYKDSFSGDEVTKSEVTIDLQGQGLNDQQVMNLCKLVLFTCIVPMNSE